MQFYPPFGGWSGHSQTATMQRLRSFKCVLQFEKEPACHLESGLIRLRDLSEFLYL